MTCISQPFAINDFWYSSSTNSIGIAIQSNAVALVMALIEVLAGIAEQERVRTLQRQAQGIAAAKEKGKHLGRPRVQFPEGWDEVYIEWKHEEMTATPIRILRGIRLRRVLI